MNTYIAERLITDMRRGARVVYVTTPVDKAIDELTRWAEQLDPPVHIVRTRGQQIIRDPHSGGAIRVRSSRERQGMRGMVADVVVIDETDRMDHVIPDAVVMTQSSGGTVLVVVSS